MCARTPCGLPHQKPCRGALVFTGPRGAPLDVSNMRDRHWLPALKLAGLQHGRQHDLRHTFTTWLISAGVPIDEVAGLLGHTTTWVTERYRHLRPGHGERGLAALNGIGLPDVAPNSSPLGDLKIAPKAL